jgi:glucose dehydrogenase
MNQTIQQSRAILAGLRQRRTTEVAVLQAMIGITGQRPRFLVLPKGSNEFRVVDRVTGEERASIAGHSSACESARRLEASAQTTAAPQRAASTLASKMTRWALTFSLVLCAIALLGVRQ